MARQVGGFMREKKEGQRSPLSGKASWERRLQADVGAEKPTNECGAKL